MRYIGIARKTASILANLSLFLNTFLPFVIAVQPAYAQSPEEAAPAIVEVSPTPEPTIAVDPTPENSPTPSEEPSPTPEPTISPIVTPPEEATPTPEITVTPEVSQNPQPSNNPTSSPESAPSDQPSVTPTAIPTPTPEKIIDPVITQNCLTGSETITDSLAVDWNYDQEKDIYETKEKVKLGVKYIFPQDNNVTVTFKCLPTNESLLSSLKIKRVKTSDLNLPENTTNVGEYAYDITTGMIDGTFKYDITLPKTSDLEAGISYIEKSLDDAKQNISAEEIKSVFQPEQQSNKVLGKDINHFTIYIATYSNSGLSVGKTSYLQGETVYTNSTSLDKNKYYRVDVINPSNNSVANSGCWSSPNSDGSSHNYNYTLSSSAPTGNWKVELTKYSNESNCNNKSSSQETKSSTFTVQNSIVTNPALSQSCGLDIALVMDNSQSITSSQRTQMKNALKSFTNALSGTPTQFSVVRFGNSASLIQSFTSNISSVNTAIDNLPANPSGEYTNWEAGLQTANNSFSGGTSRPNLVIFVTDGDPTASSAGSNDLNQPNAHLAPATTIANTIKTSGTRILVIGVGSPTLSRLQAISGTNVDTPSVQTSDVITANFDNLASQLATFASQTCGGTITVQKIISGNNNAPLNNWIFNLSNGQTYPTDAQGYTPAIHVSAGTYSVTENQKSGYSLNSAVCTKNGNSIGTLSNNTISGLTIGNSDIISCIFTNNYLPVCGDGLTGGSEQCDDGNQTNNDFCSNSCHLNTCGDGVVNGTDQCDGSAGVGPHQSCNASCQLINLPYCGDSHTDIGEECDDGNLTNTDSCLNTCKFATCGDGIVGPGEFCDDGNQNNTDSCSNTCKNTFCGDGFINAGEQCDNGDANSFTCNPIYGGSCNYCKKGTCESKTIVGPYCGDGVKNGDEQCDLTDLNGLPSSDFSCNNKCNLELINQKVTICHATNSQQNPYNSEEPNKSGNVSGHDDHNGDVWYPGIADHSWGDIIPPFYYIGGHYDGQNWTSAGQTIYNNGCQYPSGTINVVKVISNNGQNYSDFSFSVNGESPINFENDGTNQIKANIGVNYTIAEIPQPGYQVVYNGCKNISVTAGETKTCTITNNKYAKLTVIKQVDTNNDGTIDIQNATDWTWDIANGDQNIATGQSKDLIPGSYTISEDQKDGYRLKNWTCSNETSGTQNSIDLRFSPGQQVTCTITNTRITGNIKVCKVILDGSGNIVDGSALPNSVFSISGLNQSTSQGAPVGVLGTTNFTSPLTLNEKLFRSEVNNASCVTYENLVPGNYYYGQESLPSEFWGVPKYNDGVDSQNNLNDHFYTYSGQLFDENPNNDGNRQTSSDGHIILAADQTRTLIVVNQYQYAKVNVTKFNDFNGNGRQDQGEENLSDWIINLTGQESATTNSSGSVTFTNVTTGNHLLSENLKNGWMQTNIICDGQEGIDNDNSHQITLTAGQTLNCKIGNRQLGNVTVYKFNDANGNGQKDEGEENLSNWTINLTNQASLNTDANGQVIFANIIPGNYDLSENIQSQAGWKQTNIYCEDSGEGTKITAPGEAYGHHGNCYGWNGCGNAATCALWACEVKGFNHLVSYGAEKPCTQFGNCNLFWSRGSVQYNWGHGCEVSGVTDIVCSNGSNSEGNYYNNGYISGNHLTINSGQNKICYIGNQRLTPKLNISKSNNTGGNELSPGNSVEYKIALDINDNSINNLKVTDLLSDGFKYRLGSYKILRNGTDVTSQVGEPQYHSPGVWDLSALGQLTPEDNLELIYTADISTDQQAGKYADLAYASAVYGYDSEQNLLAAADEEGYIDANFVGTNVIVNRSNQNSASAEIERTETVQGQVLGASTELPATGAATLWLIISSVLGAFGLLLIKNDKISKSMAKKILSIFILPLFLFLVSSNIAFAESNLSVRLEEPKTPTNLKELQLKFVALDISGNQITVKCLKKGPTDAGFSQYCSDIILSAGGNTSSCSTSSVVGDIGTYQFKVNANGLDSNTVSVDYKNSTPGTPNDYRKDHPNNCDYKIHFKTAGDDNKTVKVEIYRSDLTSFIADNGSKVGDVNIGSNQEYDFTNSVPDCSKTYYYVIRAFDNAGNGSGTVGDTFTKTIYDGTTVTGTPAQGAIPVGGNNISPENNDQSQSENPSGEQASDQSTGQILGSETTSGNFITNHKILSGIIALVILAIIFYAFKKIRKDKKSFRRK